MAAEIIPIQLGLTAGNVLTLWAPPWIEDGEEWQAFLGHGDDLYVFPTPAHLAAFVRTSTEHDLIDHPAWDSFTDLMADELVPDDDHRFDIVGVPELVAQAPDVWTLAELTDTVAILRSLAEVCDLGDVDEVLESTDGFAALTLGESAFIGRQGEKLWNGIGSAVVSKWDRVVDSIDSLVTTPDIDTVALADAETEAAAVNAVVTEADEVQMVELEAGERDPELTFWDEIGIDCIEVTLGGRAGTTLRCYLDDEPIFLSEQGRIQIFTVDEDLENYITDPAGTHAMSALEVWPEVQEAIKAGDAVVVAGPENSYVLDGLGDALITGPGAVDAHQLDLAVELLTDAAIERKDEDTAEALTTATPLSNLIRAIVKPDTDRLPPAPPFDDEVSAWSLLVDRFADSLDWDPVNPSP